MRRFIPILKGRGFLGGMGELVEKERLVPKMENKEMAKEVKESYRYSELPTDEARENAVKTACNSPLYGMLVEARVYDVVEEKLKELCPASCILVDWEVDFPELPNRKHEVDLFAFSLSAYSTYEVQRLFRDVFTEEFIRTLPEDVLDSIVLKIPNGSRVTAIVESEASYNLVNSLVDSICRWFDSVYKEISEAAEEDLIRGENFFLCSDIVASSGLEFDADGNVLT